MKKTIIENGIQTDVDMTAGEEAAFLAEQAEAQARIDAATLKTAAQTALDKTDLTALRCLKAGVPFPAEWQAYVSPLRAIVDTGAGTLPTQPAFPAGT